MKPYINIPAKVIPVFINNITGLALWPYDSGDQYWSGGSDPKFYQWTVDFAVTPQVHSSPNTRAPNQFTGMDIQVGCYVADSVSGVAVKVVDIISKTDTNVTCVVEDNFRYNTFRDPSGLASGIFSTNVDAVVFELNEEGQPVVDPSNFSGSFYNNVSSRFQNLEQTFNFIINKVAHGFVVGQVIAADTANATFVLASSGYPFLIGTVSDVDLGPDAFTLNPFEKVSSNIDYLPGDVGSIIYSDPLNPGGISLSGDHPIMIQLTKQSNTVVTGTNSVSGTTPGSTCTINGATITVSNTGSVADFIGDVNTANTGIVASIINAQTSATATTPPIGFIQVPSAATINGQLVNFTTTADGDPTGGQFASMVDVVHDINAAAISNIVASIVSGSFSSQQVQIAETTGGSITITNDGVDGLGNPFAGPSSSTGLPLSTSASTASYVVLAAPDARVINLNDISGSALADFGLVSSESGQKAAAMVIEQGMRQASTFVVSSIPARDVLTVAVGDQAYVQNVGNGEWAFFLFDSTSSWVKIADQDSSQTDAQTAETTVLANSASSASIHSISNNRRVTFVTVSVTQAFDAPASITIGDDGQQDRLMSSDQSDLTIVGAYSSTPSYIYTSGSDTTIKYYLSANGATQGSAVVAITYT